VICFDLHLGLHPLRMEMMICDFTSRILFRPRIYCCGLLIWSYYCYYLYLHRHTNSRFYMCVHCAHFVHTLCTFCAHFVHILCTLCAHFVHTLCTFCAHFVHKVF